MGDQESTSAGAELEESQAHALDVAFFLVDLALISAGMAPYYEAWAARWFPDLRLPVCLN